MHWLNLASFVHIHYLNPTLFSSLRASLWLISLLLSSILWYALVSLCDRSDASLQLKLLATGAAVAVLLQEMLRAALYKLLWCRYSEVYILYCFVGLCEDI